MFPLLLFELFKVACYHEVLIFKYLCLPGWAIAAWMAYCLSPVVGDTTSSSTWGESQNKKRKWSKEIWRTIALNIALKLLYHQAMSRCQYGVRSK